MRSKTRDLESFGIIASSGPGPKPSELPEPDFTSKIVWKFSFLGSTIPWYHKCGHRGFVGFSVSVKGARSYKKWFSKECPQCCIERFNKDIVLCALCELPIIPGDAVAVYDANHPEIRREHAHIIKDQRGEWALGCLRWNCCPCAEFFSGNWMGAEEGFKQYDFNKQA